MLIRTRVLEYVPGFARRPLIGLKWRARAAGRHGLIRIARIARQKA